MDIGHVTLQSPGVIVNASGGGCSGAFDDVSNVASASIRVPGHKEK